MDATMRKHLVLPLFLLGLTMLISTVWYARDFFGEIEARERVSSGEVVEKNLTKNVSLLGESNPEYRLTLKVNYEYDGEQKSGTVVKIVDKDIYTSVNKGEMFNMDTLQIIR